MVVLVGGFSNITQTINITNSCSTIILNSTDPLCYSEVFAFDIKSDGSIGSLAVPGVIILNNESITQSCPPTPTTVTSISGWLILIATY